MSVRQIAIVGYGIIGQQIRHFLEEAHKGGAIEFNYFDDQLAAKGEEHAYPFDDYQDSQYDNLEFYIGLGYKHLCLRNKISATLMQMNRRFPSIIHHTAYVHPSVSIGYGSVIYPMCNIGFSVRIGNGTIINKSCTISHDTELGNGSFFIPFSNLLWRGKTGRFFFCRSWQYRSQRGSDWKPRHGGDRKCHNTGYSG